MTLSFNQGLGMGIGLGMGFVVLTILILYKYFLKLEEKFINHFKSKVEEMANNVAQHFEEQGEDLNE